MFVLGSHCGIYVTCQAEFGDVAKITEAVSFGGVCHVAQLGHLCKSKLCIS